MTGIAITITDIEGETHRIDGLEAGTSLMEAAREKDVKGIIAECGGACSCATCHVYVGEGWMDRVGTPDEVEDEMLDMVDVVRRPSSRLSCQIALSEELDGLEVEVAPEP